MVEVVVIWDQDVVIETNPVAGGKRWDWSWRAQDGRSHRNGEELAPSHEVAFAEARESAQAALRKPQV